MTRTNTLRISLAIGFLGAIAVITTSAVRAQTTGRLNPVIAVQEKHLPIFGIAHPAITAGRGGGAAAGAAAPPAIVLGDVAKETVDYTGADYLFTSGTSDTFLRYIEEIKKAGGSAHTHPFGAKVGIWHRNPENVTAAIVRQLNAGHSIVILEGVESAQEVRDAIKAVRFTSAGGTRPETGLENAAAYWGLTVPQYIQKADAWPANKNGEILIVAIVESREGLAHVREIAAEPGVGQMFAGYGTLGQVFTGDPAGRETAAAQILAACKEYKVPCGFPTNNVAEMEQRTKEGWSSFIMQRRNADGFAAIETGRKIGGR